MNPDLVGWGASAILLVTVVRQVVKQWNTASNDGVSAWMFVGQMAASLGFLIYAWMLDNPVFMLTNSVLLAAAVTGQFVYVRNRRSGAESSKKP